MDDTTYTFIERNRELKSAGRGIYHKKSGAKTSYCGLPSDHLTAAQLKKKHGPCVSLNLKKPMSGDEFKKLSPEHQKLYLGNLISEYQVSDRAIGKMFGWSDSYMSFTRRALGLKSGAGVGKKIPPEKLAMWREFIGEDKPAPVTTEMKEAVSVDEHDALIEEARGVPLEDIPDGNPIKEEMVGVSPSISRMSMVMDIKNVRSMKDLELYLSTLPFRPDVPANVHISIDW